MPASQHNQASSEVIVVDSDVDVLEVMPPSVPASSDGGSNHRLRLGASSSQDHFERINPAQLYLASLHSAVSVKSMRSRLNQFARWTGADSLDTCNWGAMRAPHIIAFLKWYENEPTTTKTQSTEKINHRLGSTLNCTLAALRGVAKHAWLCAQINQDDYARIVAVKPVRFSRLPAGRELTRAETTIIRNGLQMSQPSDLRDLAMIMLMVGCGLRRAEVPQVRFENYDREDRSLTLVGKGDKERKVFLPPPVAEAVDLWIDNVRGEDVGFMFGSIRKNEKLDFSRPLTADGVGWIFRQVLNRLGIQNAAPHDLRRTFASRLMDKGVDLATIQKLMGHANVSTTARYDRRGEDRQRRAIEDIDV